MPVALVFCIINAAVLVAVAYRRREVRVQYLSSLMHFTKLLPLGYAHDVVVISSFYE